MSITTEPLLPEPLLLYAVPTANSQRVAITLEELGLPYRVHLLDRARGEPGSAAFRAINPTAMAPTLVDGDTTVAQSGAILLYLAERCGRLLPGGLAARAKVFEWLLHTASDVQPTSSALYFARQRVAEPHGPTIDLLEGRLATFFGHCNEALAGQPHLAGELSIADLALYPLAAAGRARIDAHGLSHLARWADRLAERPAIQRGMRLSKEMQ
jgi:glutathione S-transferase